jgi:hypothetical protein
MDGKLRAGFAVKYLISAKISDSQFLPCCLLGVLGSARPALRQWMAISRDAANKPLSGKRPLAIRIAKHDLTTGDPRKRLFLECFVYIDNPQCLLPTRLFPSRQALERMAY